MARLRDLTRKTAKPELGDSWVVESDEDVESVYTSSDEELSEKTQPRRAPNLTRSRIGSTRSSETTASRHPSIALSVASTPGKVSLRRAGEGSQLNTEPELIMPSIHEELQTPRRRKVKNPKPSMAEKEANDTCIAPNPAAESSVTFESTVKPILVWILDVMGQVLSNLKTPIAYAVAGYLLFCLALMLKNFATSSVYAALSPMCRMPGVSLLNWDFCHSHVPAYRADQVPPAEFHRLMSVQSKFEDVMEQTAGGITLPLDLKRSESSLRDLRQVIRYSSIHSKNELVLEMGGFIDTARMAGNELMAFNSHIGGTVDAVISITRWTRMELDGIARRHEAKGALHHFVDATRFLSPFRAAGGDQDRLLEQYVRHARLVEDQIHKLIAEAEGILIVLRNLEDRLDVFHGIVRRDEGIALDGKEEIMALLWTRLGGNRRKLGKYEAELKTLGNVNIFRRTALAHVSGTLLKLQSMSAELHELRERVATPELLRDRPEVPLSVLLENIQLGLERLESVRGNTKAIGQSELSRKLQLGEAKEGRLID